MIQIGGARSVGILCIVVFWILTIGFYTIRYPTLARRVWQGEYVPEPQRGGKRINRNKRNWIVTLASYPFFAFGIGVGLLTEWAGLFPDLGVTVGTYLLFFGIVLLLVAKMITAFNRPKFLIPPPYHDESEGGDSGSNRHDRKADDE